MARFTLNVMIDLDNDAFQDGNAHAEIARIVGTLADRLADDDRLTEGTVRDINGNNVGTYQALTIPTE